jgi:hypothetical protein
MTIPIGQKGNVSLTERFPCNPDGRRRPWQQSGAMVAHRASLTNAELVPDSS